MNTSILKKFVLVAAIGLFSQFASAQNEANSAAITQVAKIVATINHFPSDDDLAKLDAISGNSELAQVIRDMASAVANIEHAANEEGKGAMEAIQNREQIPERGKTLASVIENFSHMASADDKAKLAEMFP